MNTQAYNLLKEMVAFSFEECHAGLDLLLYNDENFAGFVERKYRLKQYAQEGEFYMTANERSFHLMGFINAIIYLERAGLLFADHKYARICNALSADAPELDALRRIVTTIEGGDDE